MTGGGNLRDAVKRAVAARNAARRWAFDVPRGWQHEAEDTLDTFFDPDGVGALQFSSITKDSGDVTDADLLESIEDMSLQDEPRNAAAFGPFIGYALRKEHDDGHAGQYWFLRAGRVLLFATYFCDKRDVGREARVVQNALATLRILPD